MSAKVFLYVEKIDKKTKKKRYEEYNTVFFVNENNLSESGLEKLLRDRYQENLVKVTIRDISAAKFLYENKETKYTITLYLKTKDELPIVPDAETLADVNNADTFVSDDPKVNLQATEGVSANSS